MTNKIAIKNKEEMMNFINNFAIENKHKIIGLKGSLGVGKSFFAKNFINNLQEKKSEILSPTFNIVYSYQTKIGEIFHFDLYRLKNVEELENIEFFDICKNNICLIEWPEIAKNFLEKSKNYIEITISNGKLEEERIIEVKKFDIVYC